MSDLRLAYDSVGSKLTRYGIPGVADLMSFGASPEIEAFRCVGNFKRSKQPAFPRMHNKFFVGCDLSTAEDGQELFPKMVWTGSYNVSYTAQASFENAVIIDDGNVASAFAREWSQILALSEKLDWTSDWVEPEYRIGS